MEKFFCGIDISKNSFSISIIDSSLKLVFNKEYPMNSEGFNEFKNIITDNFSNCIFGMESTSLYHIPLTSFLLKQSEEIYVINAALVKKFSDFTTLRKTKSDKVDSKIIACFLSKNLSDLDNYKLHNFNELSGFARIREHLVFEISKIKTLIKQYLYPVFPEADRNIDIFSKTFMSIIIKAPSAKSISSKTTKELEEFVDYEKGRKVSVDKIINLAKESVGIESKSYESFITTLSAQYLFLTKQLDEVSKNFIEMVENTHKDKLDILKSIDGIGEITAISFLSEIEGKSFSNSKKLRAYAGTDPTIKQSGKMFINGKISKRGNSHLRRVLWIMATYVIMWNQKFKDYFNKKRSEGFSYKKAQMAVANKLIDLIYILMERKVKFNKSFS